LHSDCQILALGTNIAAAAAMRDAGAQHVASGADAILNMVPTADVIVASLNLVLPGAMLGEVTPEVAKTILEAKAKKVLLPMNRVRVEIVGTKGRTMDTLIAECLSRVRVAVQATCHA
jgi:D-arabinose 1-dehydrogenase-like Zn-dependent alcohol dehydrogenase